MRFFYCRVGYSIKKKLQINEDFYKDRESQIAAIEKSFDAAKKTVIISFLKFKYYKYLAKLHKADEKLLEAEKTNAADIKS